MSRLVHDGGSRVYVRRLESRYLISSQHPSPARLKSRLDEAVTRCFGDALARGLSPLLQDSDPSVWLIRRLDLQMDVHAGWDEQQIARAWTPHVARSVAAVLQNGQDGNEVLWFPSRAAYLARFLADAAEGRTERWYYEAFSGLRLLPTSALLRAAICEHPEVGLAALRELSPTERGTVLRALTRGDSERILDAFVADASAGDERRCFEAVWVAWQASRSLAPAEEWRHAFALCFEALARDSSLDPQFLKTAALAVVRLAQLLSGDSDALLAALAGGDRAALYSVARPGDADVLAPLLRCPSAWVRNVGHVLQSKRNAKDASDESRRRDTPFGGTFLLLPLLDALPLEKATEGWPAVADMTPATLVRFILLLKCSGRSAAREIFRDPVVRELMAVPPALSTADLGDWQARISSADRRRLLEVMAEWHAENGAVGGAVWILTSVRAPGGPVALAIDGRRGVWLFAGRCRPGQPTSALRELRRTIPAETRVIISDAEWMKAVGVVFPELRATGLDSDAAQALAREDPSLAETIARLDRLADDWSFVRLPRTLAVGGQLDVTLGVAAQGIMRALAWRLPGFAGSHLSHLHRNFLDFRASIEDEPGRRVVRVGRPPLHLVLGLTGMMRASYRLSWLDDRPLALFPEG